MTGTCSGCGHSYTETVPATRHSWEGERCAACGMVCSHSYSSKVTTAATCTTKGVKTYTCSGCNDSYTETLPATGHRFDSSNVCTVCGYRKDVVLVINVTSFGKGEAVLRLTPDEPRKPESGEAGSYTYEPAPGEYVLTVSKENHVTREYTITMGTETLVLDVKLHMIGDIDGSGKINAGDVAKLYAHLKGKNRITDEYMLLCCDVNGGGLNMGDVAALYAHMKGAKKLY